MKFCWTTIHVKNIQESIDFYEHTVGLCLNTRFKTPDGMEIAFLGEGETKLELIQPTQTEEISYHELSLGFEIETIEKTIDNLKNKNIFIDFNSIVELPNIRFFQIKGPNGEHIQFVQNK